MKPAVRREPTRLLLVAVLAALGAGGIVRPDEDDDGRFGLTEPVACKEINGFEDFVPLKEAALTADEKLLVYYRPRHYKTARVSKKYEAHLWQDGRIRRKGQKIVVWTKNRLLDYHPLSDDPPSLIYLRNTISLKGLKPGEYEYDIVLHDEVGQSSPATRSLPFKIVPNPAPSKGAQNDPGRPDARPGSDERS